jgi:CRISPR system Cascade subunit CasA
MSHTDDPSEAPPAPAFNLLDSPWLPVRYLDGRQAELGLLALFEQAHQIEGLAETSPPNLVALYRLLLAITHRALTRHVGRWTDRDRARWYAQGLPAGAVTNYLTHWRDRFWLFHPDHPFMQVAALASAEETRGKLKPWTQVALDSINGNQPVMFDHSLDQAPRPMPAAAVLRSMLGFLQFTPGGTTQVFRLRDEDGPLCNCAAALAIGGNLEQTLLLALHPAPADQASDIPAWEPPPPAMTALPFPPSPATGPCDRYTRLSRSVLLRQADDEACPTVSRLQFAEGRALVADANAPDPMVSFRQGMNGPVKITFSEGRALWRDMGALLPEASTTGAKPAATLTWAQNLLNAGVADDTYLPILVAGQASTPGKMKILRARSERFVLPGASLTQTDTASVVRAEILRCELLYRDLATIATDLLARAMPDPNSKDTRARARALLDAGPFAATYFSTAERRLPALLQLIGQADLDAAHADWSSAMLLAGSNAWDAARGMLGQSAAALRAEALTHRRLQAALRPLRPAPAASPVPQPRPTEEAMP